MKNSLDDVDNEEVKFEDVKTEGSDEVESFEMVFWDAQYLNHELDWPFAGQHMNIHMNKKQ